MLRFTVRAAGALVVLCAILPRVGHAADPITLRFAPPDSLTFVETLVTAREKTYEGLGKQVDSSVARTSVHVERRGAGYVVTATPLSLTGTRNGRPVADPVNDLLAGIVVTYFVGADGQIDSITGYGDLADRIARMLPPAAAAAPVLSKRSLTQRDVAEWNGRIGDFAGATVTVGQRVDTTSPYTLPSGEAITYAMHVRFSGWESCASADSCLRIDTEFDSDAAALGGVVSGRVSGALGTGRDSLTVRPTSRLYGWSHRLVDPRTLLIHGEVTSRTIVMTVHVPDHGDVPVTLKEERRYTYAYP